VQIGRHTTLFFDASVLVAGAHSPNGGSGLLLSACKAGGFRAQATIAVAMESIGALEGLPETSLARFYRLLSEIRWEFLHVPSAQVLERYKQYIEPKDVHVLAAAVKGGSEFLLTLDRRHILAVAGTEAGARLPIIILTPGDFIQRYYRLHEDYPALPPARGDG
jgi:predicted nucleic acid-binding protein